MCIVCKTVLQGILVSISFWVGAWKGVYVRMESMFSIQLVYKTITVNLCLLEHRSIRDAIYL